MDLTQRRAESQRQQLQQQPEEEKAMITPSSLPDVEAGNMHKALPLQQQRSALKFGFAAKSSANKVGFLFQVSHVNVCGTAEEISSLSSLSDKNHNHGSRYDLMLFWTCCLNS